jgi:hypothetical protein
MKFVATITTLMLAACVVGAPTPLRRPQDQQAHNSMNYESNDSRAKASPSVVSSSDIFTDAAALDLPKNDKRNWFDKEMDHYMEHCMDELGRPKMQCDDSGFR